MMTAGLSHQIYKLMLVRENHVRKAVHAADQLNLFHAAVAKHHRYVHQADRLNPFRAAEAKHHQYVHQADRPNQVPAAAVVRHSVPAAVHENQEHVVRRKPNRSIQEVPGVVRINRFRVRVVDLVARQLVVAINENVKLWAIQIAMQLNR